MQIKLVVVVVVGYHLVISRLGRLVFGSGLVAIFSLNLCEWFMSCQYCLGLVVLANCSLFACGFFDNHDPGGYITLSTYRTCSDTMIQSVTSAPVPTDHGLPASVVNIMLSHQLWFGHSPHHDLVGVSALFLVSRLQNLKLRRCVSSFLFCLVLSRYGRFRLLSWLSGFFFVGLGFSAVCRNLRVYS